MTFLGWKTHPANSRQQHDMASARQIAANRRNATRSTGPRSRGGKQRAGRNAYRHGLSMPIATSATLAKQIDTRTRKIARDAKRDPEEIIALEHASLACGAQSSS